MVSRPLNPCDSSHHWIAYSFYPKLFGQEKGICVDNHEHCISYDHSFSDCINCDFFYVIVSDYWSKYCVINIMAVMFTIIIISVILFIILFIFLRLRQIRQHQRQNTNKGLVKMAYATSNILIIS